MNRDDYRNREYSGGREIRQIYESDERDFQENAYRGAGRNHRGPRNPQEASLLAARKKRRRRRMIIGRIIRVVLFLVITIGLIAGIAGGCILLGRKSFNGSWSRNIDITQEVRANMISWLSTVNDEEINTEWISERTGDYSIKTTLTFESTGISGGTYSEVLDMTVYDETVNRAYLELESVLKEIIKKQLLEKEYADDISDEELTAISGQVLGMSISDYLRSNEITILPSLEELSQRAGCSTGEYAVKRGVMTLNGIEERFVKQKNTLVFTDAGKVYTREENK